MIHGHYSTHTRRFDCFYVSDSIDFQEKHVLSLYLINNGLYRRLGTIFVWIFDVMYFIMRHDLEVYF